MSRPPSEERNQKTGGEDPKSTPLAAAQAEDRRHRAAVLFLALTTLFRLCLLPSLELAPDEAYYWDWSRHPALGYYDQGPLIAYLIRVTTALFGNNEFGVRIGVLLASLGTLVCVYSLARRFYGARAGFLALLFLALSPLLTVGSLIATYDPPLVFFWALALVFLERALFATAPRSQNRAWLLAGLATGLGFLSKHTMLLLLPCLLLFLLLSPPHRFWLRRPQPYLAFLLTLLCYSGVFWWNARHHWWTFGHLLFLTRKSSSPPLHRLGDFLGSQALLLGPGLFLGCLASFAEGVRRATAGTTQKPSILKREVTSFVSPQPANIPETAKTLFLLCFGLPIFLFFCLMTFKAKVQGNWAPCAWLTPTIALAGWLAGKCEGIGAQTRSALRFIGGIGALSGLITLLMLSPGLRFRLGVRLPPDADLSNTAYGWRTLARHAAQIRAEMHSQGHPVFLAANDYQYCALLAFYLPDHPPTYDLFLHNRLTMYAAYIEDLRRHLGEDALYINDNQVEDADLRALFSDVKWDPPLPIRRRPYYATPIRTLYFARCRHYRRFLGLEWARGG